MSTGSKIVPTTVSITSQSKPVAVEIYKPSSAGKHPAVVVAYGTDAMNAPWGSQIGDFAGFLADHGYVAMIPHYFDVTGTVPGLGTAFASIDTDRDVWVKAINDTLIYANSLTSYVQTGKLGLLGFSLGGHLVLRQSIFGSTFERAGAVVDFFAPVASTFPNKYSIVDSPSKGVGMMPPVQIHHGNDDVVVSPDQSRDLVNLLKAAGKTEGTDFLPYFYPREGHGFHLAADISQSMDRTLKFFDAHIR
jgi:dienelactone hydrolase